MIKTGECKIRLLDEVTAVVVGLRDDHMETMYNQYAVQASNYIFSPQYKLGRWDGKYRYFSKAGKTYIYLLEDIIPRIVRLGYKIKLEDLRDVVQTLPQPITGDIFSHIPHPDTGLPIVLHQYQVDIVNTLIESGYGVCEAATGAGKTLMCAALVTAFDRVQLRTLTIVPDETLINQTKADYAMCQLNPGEYSGAEKTLTHNHVVSTWQALQHNPNVIKMFDVVIVDECHGLRGAVLQKLLCEYGSRLSFRYGFTGTIPKDQHEQMQVHVAVGPKRYTITARELQELGQLSTCDIDVIQLEEDLAAEYKQFCDNENPPGSKPPTYTEFKDGYFPDYPSEKSHIHKQQSRTEWIADMLIAKRDSGAGNTIVFVDSISFGRKLAEMIPGSYLVNGQDTKKVKERKAIYELFKTRDDLIVIATVHIAGTGLNIRRIFNLVLVDIGKSFTRVIQAIGRGLRTASDKDTLHVYDISSDLKYGKKHLRTRLQYYREAYYPYVKRKVDYNKQLATNGIIQ